MSGGGCPPVPSRLTVLEPDAIRIDMTQPPSDGACTTELRIYPVVIQVDPKQIDVHRRLTVSLYYPQTKRPAVYHLPAL